MVSQDLPWLWQPDALFFRGSYELTLLSEALKGSKNFWLLLDDLELSYELLQVFFEAKDIHTLKKKMLHEGKTTSHFGECNEKTGTFLANSFLWAMNK